MFSTARIAMVVLASVGAVSSRAADKDVVAVMASETVIAGSTHDVVGAEAAVDVVVAGTAFDGVAALYGQEEAGVGRVADGVVPRTASQNVLPRPAAEVVVAASAVQHIGAAPTVRRGPWVVPRAEVNAVGVRTPIGGVGAAAAAEDVVARAAGINQLPAPVPAS